MGSTSPTTPCDLRHPRAPAWAASAFIDGGAGGFSVAARRVKALESAA